MVKKKVPFIILLYIFGLGYAALALPGLILFVIDGFKGGYYRAIVTTSIILFSVGVFYLLDNIKFSKTWIVDSVIGEIKIISYSKYDFSTGISLYIQNELVKKEDSTIWELSSYSGRLEYLYSGMQSKQYLVEADFFTKNLGFKQGCKIYLNRELILET